MGYLFLKFVASASIIVGVSEIAKRSSFAAALIASLPITTMIACIWIYMETKSTDKIITLSYEIAWLVLPSIIFFIILPHALKHGIGFWMALLIACVSTLLAYGVTICLHNLIK